MDNVRLLTRTTQAEIDKFPVLVLENYYPEKLDKEASNIKTGFAVGFFLFAVLGCVALSMIATYPDKEVAIAGALILCCCAVACSLPLFKSNSKLVADKKMKELGRKAKNDPAAKSMLEQCEKEIVNLERNNGEENIIENESIVKPRGKDIVIDKKLVSDLHGMIHAVSFQKYQDGHYADSVESAFKEINTRLKKYCKEKCGIELDGERLFSRCFNCSADTLLKVSDISTMSGKNDQEGFRQILVGAWQSQRNPKAHENLTITKEDAIHGLNLASMLMYKIDGAIESARCD